MLKVVHINIAMGAGIRDNNNFKEMEFPKLQKYIEEDYAIKDVIQSISPSTSYLNLTFILEKVS